MSWLLWRGEEEKEGRARARAGGGGRVIDHQWKTEDPDRLSIANRSRTRHSNCLTIAFIALLFRSRCASNGLDRYDQVVGFGSTHFFLPPPLRQFQTLHMHGWMGLSSLSLPKGSPPLSTVRRHMPSSHVDACDVYVARGWWPLQLLFGQLSQHQAGIIVSNSHRIGSLTTACSSTHTKPLQARGRAAQEWMGQEEV